MGQIKSFDDLTNAMRKEDVKVIDKTKLKQYIRENRSATGVKSRMKYSVKLSSITACMIILIVSTVAFGDDLKDVIKYYLFNEEDNVSFTLQEMEKSDRYNVEQSKDLDNNGIFKEVFNSMEPGQILAYISTEFTDKTIWMEKLKPKVFNDINEAKLSVSTKFKSPSVLPEGYKLDRVKIKYRPKLTNEYKTGNLAQELFKKAEKENSKYAYKILEQSDKVFDISIVFKSDKRKPISLHILNTSSVQTAYSLEKTKVSKLDINGKEAMIVESPEEYKPYEIIFIDESSDMRAYTFNTTEELTEEEIVTMLSSLE